MENEAEIKRQAALRALQRNSFIATPLEGNGLRIDRFKLSKKNKEKIFYGIGGLSIGLGILLWLRLYTKDVLEVVSGALVLLLTPLFFFGIFYLIQKFRWNKQFKNSKEIEINEKAIIITWPDDRRKEIPLAAIDRVIGQVENERPVYSQVKVNGKTIGINQLFKFYPTSMDAKREMIRDLEYDAVKIKEYIEYMRTGSLER